MSFIYTFVINNKCLLVIMVCNSSKSRNVLTTLSRCLVTEGSTWFKTLAKISTQHHWTVYMFCKHFFNSSSTPRHTKETCLTHVTKVFLKMNWPFLLFLNKIVIFYQIYLIFFLDKTHKLFLGTDKKFSQKWRIMALELKLKVIIECVYIWAYLKDLIIIF